MTDWFYEDNGAPRGPITEADLRTMLQNGFMPPQARVWTQAFGAEWRAASQTELASTPRGASPPPLGAASVVVLNAAYPVGRNSANGTPQALVQQGIATTGSIPATAGHAPPTKLWEMLIGFSPIAWVALHVALAETSADFQIGSDLAIGAGFTLNLLCCWFAFCDANALQRAGRNPEGRSSVPFMFLLTPVGYFLRRRAISQTSLGPLWLFLGCAVVAALFETGMTA